MAVQGSPPIRHSITMCWFLQLPPSPLKHPTEAKRRSWEKRRQSGAARRGAPRAGCVPPALRPPSVRDAHAQLRRLELWRRIRRPTFTIRLSCHTVTPRTAAPPAQRLGGFNGELRQAYGSPLPHSHPNCAASGAWGDAPVSSPQMLRPGPGGVLPRRPRKRGESE